MSAVVFHSKVPVERTQSNALASAMATIEFASAVYGPPAIRLSADTMQEAQHALAVCEAALVPCDPRDLKQWMMALNDAVGNPLSRDDFASRLRAASVLISDIPACSVNFDTLRDAMRRFRFYPSVAELISVFAEPAEILKAKRRNLKKLIACAQTPTTEENDDE